MTPAQIAHRAIMARAFADLGWRLVAAVPGLSPLGNGEEGLTLTVELAIGPIRYQSGAWITHTTPEMAPAQARTILAGSLAWYEYLTGVAEMGSPEITRD